MHLGSSRAALLLVLLLVLPAVPARTGRVLVEEQQLLRTNQHVRRQTQHLASSRKLLAPAGLTSSPATAPLCVAAVNFGAAGIGDVNTPEFIGSFGIVLLHNAMVCNLTSLQA
jgi:hypothetical protein